MNSKSPLLIFLVFLTSLFTVATFGSDHIDGKVTSIREYAQGDLTDLFVYPTPGVPKSLTVILDSYPFVSSSGHFSEKINFNIIFRKTWVAADNSHFETDAKSEVIITCRFATPNGSNSGIQITCQSNDSDHRIMGQIAFGEINPSKVGNNIQLYAGRRLDPFFLSKNYASSFMNFKKGKPDGANIIAQLNCLSIVMNIGVDQLFPPNQASNNAQLSSGKKGVNHQRKIAQAEDSYMIAVASESLTFDNGKARRLDRLGRPEITNISMNMLQNIKNARGIDIRDLYNLDPVFAVPPANKAQYASRLNSMIKKYDTIDNSPDWSDTKLNQLTSILVDDFLIVDPFAASCQQSNFFEIEKSLLRNQTHRSCGGRDPNDNIVNKLYTIYEHGPNFSVDVADDANDGLSGPTVPPSLTFPYLNAPDDSLSAGLKRLAALVL